MKSADPVYTALLVDDERLACKRMAGLLAGHPEIQVIGAARDLTTARELLRVRAPDVVFLDIQLSSEHGFDLLPDLQAETDVIFVTAHDAFALRAFEANALDYLLKPVLPERLAACIQRLKRLRRTPANPSEPGPRPGTRLTLNDPLLLRDGRRWHRLPAAAVAAIRGEGSYSRLYATNGESLLLLRTLQEWTELLPAEHFVRLSRSIVVNLSHVLRFESIDRDRADLHLKGHRAPLLLGRVAAARLRRVFQARQDS